MNNSLEISVSSLDAPHRRALEELIGAPLHANQHLVIQVCDGKTGSPIDPRPKQTVEDWASIYRDLTESEIDEIDRLINSRDSSSRDID